MLNRIAVVLLCVFWVLFVGCENNPTQSSSDISIEAHTLAKPAISSPLTISTEAVAGTAEPRMVAPRVLAIEVVGDLSGSVALTERVTLQFTRSTVDPPIGINIGLSFNPTWHLWLGNWRLPMEGGYYNIRAVMDTPSASTNPNVVGEWHSVPLNQGELIELRLKPGHPAEIVHKGSVVVHVGYDQLLEGRFIDSYVDREKGIFTIYVPIPPSAPRAREYQLVWHTLIDHVTLRGSLDDQGRMVFTGKWFGETANPAISLVAFGVSGSSSGELTIFALEQPSFP